MFIENGKPDARLALALDPSWLQENLARSLWRESETPGQIDAVLVQQVRETKKGVTMLYSVALNGVSAPCEQMYVGYLVRYDDLAEEFKSLAKKAQIQPEHGRAVALLPEAGLILAAYPNDRKLALLSAEELRVWLPEHLHEISAGELRNEDWRVQNVTLEPLRYVPERRFTAHCRAQLEAMPTSNSPRGGALRCKEISFIAKQVGDEKKAKRLYRNLLSLEHALAQLEHVPFRVPRALAWNESRAAVFIEYLPGNNLKQLLFELNLERMMPRVGEMLAVFHRVEKRVRKRVSFSSELRENREALRDIAEVLPQMRPRLRRLFAALEQMRWASACAPALLHGTFRLNHVFLHEDELVLFDLDSLRLGDPAYDLANFLTSLYYLEAQERIAPELRRKIASHFLQGYAAAAKNQVAPFAVLWFFASLMINKQASKYVGHFHDDCEDKVARMLGLAEAALSAAQTLPAKMALTELAKVLP